MTRSRKESEAPKRPKDAAPPPPSRREVLERMAADGPEAAILVFLRYFAQCKRVERDFEERLWFMHETFTCDFQRAIGETLAESGGKGQAEYAKGLVTTAARQAALLNFLMSCADVPDPKRQDILRAAFFMCEYFYVSARHSGYQLAAAMDLAASRQTSKMGSAKRAKDASRLAALRLAILEVSPRPRLENSEKFADSIWTEVRKRMAIPIAADWPSRRTVRRQIQMILSDSP